MELVLQGGISCHRWNDPSFGVGWVPYSAGNISWVFAPCSILLTHACAIECEERSRSSCPLGSCCIQQQFAQRYDDILTEYPSSELYLICRSCRISVCATAAASSLRICRVLRSELAKWLVRSISRAHAAKFTSTCSLHDHFTQLRGCLLSEPSSSGPICQTCVDFRLVFRLN